MNALYLGQELLHLTNKVLQSNLPEKVGESGATMCESSLTSGIIQRKTKTFLLPVSVSEKEHDQEQFWSRGLSKKKWSTTRNPLSHGLQESWNMALKLLHTFQSWSGGMKYLTQCASNAEITPKVNCREVNQILNEPIPDIDRASEMEGNTAPSAG